LTKRTQKGGKKRHKEHHTSAVHCHCRDCHTVHVTYTSPPATDRCRRPRERTKPVDALRSISTIYTLRKSRALQDERTRQVRAIYLIVESTASNALRSVVWLCGCISFWGECCAFTGVAQGAPAQYALHAPAVRPPCARRAQVKAEQLPRSCPLFIAQKRRDGQLSHRPAPYETTPTHDIATKQTYYHAKLGGRISLGRSRDGPRTTRFQAAQDRNCTQS
jgi:hypothetical protein